MKKPFDKYFYYEKAVQAPKAEVQFMMKTYRSVFGKTPKMLREDFCGTFQICGQWVKQGSLFKAIGVDLSQEPLNYGKAHTLPSISSAAQKRLTLLQEDVLTPDLPKADVICALNFSYFIFKSRETLKRYFYQVYDQLPQQGLMVLDCFGGSLTMEPNEEATRHQDPSFTYYWEQASFNPVSHEALFHIHFKRRGEAKRKKVFTYDWRLWSLVELQDLCQEVGFKEPLVYWEGTSADGTGNGTFRPTKKGDLSQAWVAYLVAVKA